MSESGSNAQPLKRYRVKHVRRKLDENGKVCGTIYDDVIVEAKDRFDAKRIVHSRYPKTTILHVTLLAEDEQGSSSVPPEAEA